MPTFNLECFQSSTPKMNMKQNFPIENFKSSRISKMVEIQSASDTKAMDNNKEILIKKMKIKTVDDDFMSKLIYYWTQCL